MPDREKLRIAGWAVAALVAVILGVRLLHAGGSSAGAPVTVAPSSAGAPSAAAPGRRPGAQLMVQVAGEVARPGVYQVAAGSRVNDAVAQAGGLTHRADPAGVNLVARVEDGQQVVVPRRGAAQAAAAGASAGGSSAAPATGPVSLSSASAQQLDGLDGIGPTLAQRIVEYRQAHGGFSSTDQLRNVQGIGEKRFAALKKAVAP